MVAPSDKNGNDAAAAPVAGGPDHGLGGRPFSSRRVLSARRRHALVGVILLAASLSASHKAADAQDGEYLEYDVKATLLIKLLRFATWPAPGGAHEEPPFVIGVLGDNPFDDALKEAAEDKHVHGRPIRIRYAVSVEELRDASAVFIADPDAEALAKYLDVLGQQPILTVSDHEGFAQKGVMINFVLEKKKVRFEINYGAVREAGLDLDAQLLKLATIIESAPNDTAEDATPEGGEAAEDDLPEPKN